MASIENLSRMKRVDLRTIWPSEAGHFTPWLASERNLSLLADTLGLDLELEAQEKGVGPYRADIVCKDATDGSMVLIENQVEKTDHTHLGQLITYAAGLGAVTIVWIAERFTDEHRAALDWLNEVTGDKISFVGLEIELWKIDDSPVAPKFNIVSKPNDWTRSGGSGSAGGGVVTETRLLQQEYWQALREALAQRRSTLKPHKASPQHWLSVSIGRSHIHMSALVNTTKQRIAVALYMDGPDAKKWFKALEAQRSQIEMEFGTILNWQELPERGASRISVGRENSDIEDRDKWSEQHGWLADMLEKMSRVFRQRVKSLPSSEDEGSD